MLRERLFSTLSSAEPEAESVFEVAGEVVAPGAVRAWLDTHARDGRRVAVSFAGVTGPIARRDLDGIALAAGEPTVEQRAAGATAGVPAAGYLALTGLTPDDEAALGDWLADPSVPKAAHDVKPVLHALRARGWTLGGLTSDTALAAYLAKPGQRTFDLADLALRYLRRELRTEEPADGQLSLLGGEEEADARAAEQEMLAASAIAELADALDADLAERGGSELLADLELPLAFVLADCEAAGIAVDGETLSDLESDFGTQVREAARQAYEVIGKEINLGSPKQLQVVLFDELEMPKTKRTKTGYTTDADALASLYAQTEHPFLQFLLQHRDATRLKVTVDGLMKSVAEDGRIHTTYSQTIAATGRLSSTDPNLQNVPIRTAAGRRIRDAFVVGSAPDGTPYAELLTADYSQIEMRIMAHLSEDAALIEAFRSQHDFHAETAARVFGVAATEVTPEQRAKIKAMNYGLAYGLSAYGLSGQLRISTEEAKGLMDDYFAGVRPGARLPRGSRRPGPQGRLHRHHPGAAALPARPDQRQPSASGDGRADGAQRPDPGQRGGHHQGRDARGVPGVAGRGLRSRMLLQVHDELVPEVAEGEREALEALVRREMAAAADLSVPLEVSVGSGRSWDAAAH